MDIDFEPFAFHGPIGFERFSPKERFNEWHKSSFYGKPTKVETVEEFLARGGKIKKCKPGIAKNYWDLTKIKL